VLKINRGYSPEYLLKEVATGRENYYTGAVAEGEPPGRWWGTGAEKLGLVGLVDAQDMRGVYERFLDPRHGAFKDTSRWEEAATLGHPGRRYLSEDELYARALEREPDAAAERRAELRTEAGKAARHNVAFFDVTFSVQKSVTLLHAAFEAQEVAARNAGDEETAAAWAEFRSAVENAIWAGNNAGLAYLAENAGYTRVGHHGGAAGRWASRRRRCSSCTSRAVPTPARSIRSGPASTASAAPWRPTCASTIPTCRDCTLSHRWGRPASPSPTSTPPTAPLSPGSRSAAAACRCESARCCRWAGRGCSWLPRTRRVPRATLTARGISSSTARRDCRRLTCRRR